MEQLYAIKIIEYLERTVLVKADELDAAISKVESAYGNGEIILTADDCIKVEFQASSPWVDGIFTGSKELQKCFEEI